MVKGSTNQKNMRLKEQYTAEQWRSIIIKANAEDKQARAIIVDSVDPMIRYQTDRFCRRFCRENRYQFRCTLMPPMNNRKSGTEALCEWANGSYAWMLEDLTNNRRLDQYEGKNDAGLDRYLYTVINSLAFYERWKNWRFGRRIHVPTYIQVIDPMAHKVFLAMKSGDSIPLIAQKINDQEENVKNIVQQIIIELTERKKLYLLDSPKTVSLSSVPEDGDSNESEMLDLPESHPTPEQLVIQHQEQQRLNDAWQTLSVIEQFVLEALVIEGQDANDVLQVLTLKKIELKHGVAADKTNRQQLYYFRRKALAKLAAALYEG